LEIPKKEGNGCEANNVEEHERKKNTQHSKRVGRFKEEKECIKLMRRRKWNCFTLHGMLLLIYLFLFSQ